MKLELDSRIALKEKWDTQLSSKWQLKLQFNEGSCQLTRPSAHTTGLVSSHKFNNQVQH